MKRKGLYIGAIFFSVAGFLLAILLNLVIPQVADVTFEAHRIGIILLTANDVYLLVLAALTVGFVISGAVCAEDPDKRKKYAKKSAFRFACGIALFFWDLLGTKLQILPQPFFPGPAGIMEAFVAEGDFILRNTLYSLRLYLCGFLLGTFIGILTGVLIGWFHKAHYWLSPVLNIAGVIPAVAWMPFALTLLPTPFSAAVFLIMICVWFQVASLTVSGVQGTPKALMEAGKTLGANNLFLVMRVAIPNALPQIFTGITTANALAFTTLVMAEMMGQPGGLGYYINASKVWSAYYKVFASILVMAILFSAITKVLKLVEKKALRWQKGVVK